MFRKHPQCVENFLEMCVLMPGDGRAAGTLLHTRSLQMSSSGFAFESSIGSPSQTALNWDAAGTGTWDGGGCGQGGLGYSTDPIR